MIEELKKILSIIKENINCIKKGKFEKVNLNKLEYENHFKDLKHYFNIDKSYYEYCPKIISIKKFFEENLSLISEDFKSLCKKYDEIMGKLPSDIIEELDKIYSSNFNLFPFQLTNEKKIYKIKYNDLDLKSSLLSIPTIIKINNKLKCNYKKIISRKGPFCPELYSKPIILDIMSFVDEEIDAKIKEYSEKDDEDEKNEIYNKENENIHKNGEKKYISEGEEETDEKEESDNNNEKEIENIQIITKKDDEHKKYMTIKGDGHFKPKESIKIEIYIPKNEDGKKKIQKIRRILELTSGKSKSNVEIEIEMQILTVPIELLLSCSNYKLEFKKASITLTPGNLEEEDYYYIKADVLLSNEELIFKIQNYMQGDNYLIKTEYEALEGNNISEPMINQKGNLLIIKIPSIDDEIKRIKCKIECYINQNYKIPIRINSVIIPDNFDFLVYDYIEKYYTSNKINLILPTGNNQNNYFKKYSSDAQYFEINLHLIIIIPYPKGTIKAKIKCKSNNEQIILEYPEKEIQIKEEQTKFSCKIKIDYGNIVSSELCTLECEIGKTTKHINIEKIDFNGNFDNITKGVDIFECKSDYNLVQIENNSDLSKDKIYLCAFGFWNYQMFKYNYNSLDDIPKNNKIYSISREGEIFEQENFDNNNYAIFGIRGNEWYPLIDYKKENDLFNVISDYDYFKKTLKKQKDFKQYLKLNFPETYKILKIKDKDKESISHDYKKIFNNIQENVLNILERLKDKLNKSSSSSLDFSYLAYKIFKKPEVTLKSLKSYLPKSIKDLLKDEIDSILKENNNSSKINEKINLIKKIYKIFKDKKKEIENNNLNKIKDLVIKLKEKFYPFDLNKELANISTKYSEKYSQNIKEIIETISEEENRDNENESLLISHKFLIKDKKPKKVPKDTEPNKQVEFAEKNNKLDYDIINIDNIDIDVDEIIQPSNYSINSLIKFLKNCIFKTQIMPSFILHAVKHKKNNGIQKANKIISELYNLYKILNDHNHSLLSSIIMEYQKSFQIMFSKLKISGVDFSGEEELNKLEFDKNNQLQDYIKLPQKDNLYLLNEKNNANNNNNNSNSTFKKPNKKIFNQEGIKSSQEFTPPDYEVLIFILKFLKMKMAHMAHPN